MQMLKRNEYSSYKIVKECFRGVPYLSLINGHQQSSFVSLIIGNVYLKRTSMIDISKINVLIHFNIFNKYLCYNKYLNIINHTKMYKRNIKEYIL